MEYRATHILGPDDDQELSVTTVHAEDEFQAAFLAGYKLRQNTDGRPARLLSLTLYVQPQTVYFKPNPAASHKAAEKTTINSQYGKGHPCTPDEALQALRDKLKGGD